MGKKISDYLKLNIFKGDIGIWMIYFLLCMVSLVAIYSASSNLTFKSGNHWEPVVSQAGFLLFGLLIIIAINNVPCKFFKLIPLFGMPIAIGMLGYVLLKQQGVNDAARWIDIFGVKFQPSEFAKSMLILQIAVVLSKVNQRKRKLSESRARNASETIDKSMRKAFYVCSAYACLTCGLIAPENFSTAGMLFLVIATMMYVGNIPLKYLGKGFAVIGAIGGFALFLMFATPEETLKNYRRALTWKHRIESKFVHSDSDDENATINMEEKWQENTAHIAIANSNVVGLGVGNSIERDFLPHAESDFIYSIIVEETGIFGGLLVLMLYVMLLVRVWKIAQKCDKYFPAYLIIGLGLMMVVQALVNMAVSVGLFPVTGQTLPLISHGGTSIIITSFNMGMILSVSRYAQSVTEKAKALEMASANETQEFASSEGMQ